MKTLLEQAIELTPRNNNKTAVYTEEHYDLAIAWLKGRIGGTQVSKVLGVSRQNVYLSLSNILKQAVEEGYLKIQL